MKINSKKEKGFTLIELLVVVAIIGLLASIILASLNSARAKARDAERAQEVHQLKVAMELYYSDNGFYPSPGSDNAGYWISSITAPLTPYLGTLLNNPDPLGTDYIWTYVRGSPTSYGIVVYYEKIAHACLTGVNYNPNWFALSAYICPF